MSQEQTALAVVDRGNTALTFAKPLSIEDIARYGEIFFKGGLFEDVKNANAAMTKIIAGQELGIPPFAAMNGIHIIKGKTSVGAKLQASILNNSESFFYKAVELTAEKCTLEFYGRDRLTGKWGLLGISEFTMRDAVVAGLADKDNTQNGKGSNGHMYRKYPKNMLFARAMTNGVSWFCPEVLRGSSGTSYGIANDFDAEELPGRELEAINPDPKPAVATAREIPAEPKGERSIEKYHPDGTPVEAAQPMAPTTEHDRERFTDDTDNRGAIDVEIEEGGQPDLVELTPIEQKRARAMDLLNEKFSEDIEEIEKYLRGRVLVQMTEPALDALIHQLEAL